MVFGAVSVDVHTSDFRLDFAAAAFYYLTFYRYFVFPQSGTSVFWLKLTETAQSTQTGRPPEIEIQNPKQHHGRRLVQQEPNLSFTLARGNTRISR
jgi:hypothetical protein